MTLDEIEQQLPWGLHDALLLRLSVDWTRAELVLDVRLMITERQDMDQLARIVVTGLVFCAVDAPEIDPARGYVPTSPTGLRIDAGPGAARGASLPAVPEGCFLQWIFVSDWNRYIHVCGREAALAWLEDAPQPSGAGGRALFPGDEVPD
jgi:hypothetical protein